MKTILTIIILCGVCCGYAQNTPRYAASTKTWRIGNQTWSDAIQIPACNREYFEDSVDAPQCRSYTDNEGKTYYYYNLSYVEDNEAKLCPSPWRIPTKSDFETLVNNANKTRLITAWGYGGRAASSSVLNVDSQANYWSTTWEHVTDPLDFLAGAVSGIYFLNYSRDFENLYVDLTLTTDGFQVRCVK
jgi:hypothetical protein